MINRILPALLAISLVFSVLCYGTCKFGKVISNKMEKNLTMMEQ